MERYGTAVALGLFDGVHLGHRAVLKMACAQRENGLEPAVFTFDPDTVSCKPGAGQGYIYGQRQKWKLIGECGISCFYSPPFEKIKSWSGEAFVKRVLKQRFNAVFVCCGRDFRFGNKASCGVDELREFGKCYGFEVRIVDDVVSGGGVVSSSEIRRLLCEGSIERANELLGRDYSVFGTVVDGNHIGRTIDFPTINQGFAEGQLVPRYGVYSTVTNVDGRLLPSVTNIGVKPTIAGERRPLAETHIIGYKGDLYGKEVEVSFRSFIRPETKFASLDELRDQIAADIKIAQTDI